MRLRVRDLLHDGFGTGTDCDNGDFSRVEHCTNAVGRALYNRTYRRGEAWTFDQRGLVAAHPD
jgi:hypothetical protein